MGVAETRRFGVCITSCGAIHERPSAKLPLISELLFGDPFEVLSSEGDFLRIRCEHDRYEGWVDHRQCVFIRPDEFTRLQESARAVVTDRCAVARWSGGELLVPAGSRLALSDSARFSIAGEAYHLVGSTTMPDPVHGWKGVGEFAQRYLGSPYRWGGRSPWGLDCSGFIQVLFSVVGVSLPRDTSDQIRCGDPVSDLGDVRPGDLVFARSAESNGLHVGLVWENGTVIHSSGKVRIDQLTRQGILDSSSAQCTHRLESLRRLIKL